MTKSRRSVGAARCIPSTSTDTCLKGQPVRYDALHRAGRRFYSPSVQNPPHLASFDIPIWQRTIGRTLLALIYAIWIIRRCSKLPKGCRTFRKALDITDVLTAASFPWDTGSPAQSCIGEITHQRTARSDCFMPSTGPRVNTAHRKLQWHSLGSTFSALFVSEIKNWRKKKGRNSCRAALPVPHTAPKKVQLCPVCWQGSAD